mmetsp:Transcript_4943/g.10459  ORF Transcript_4943/g.10459 Transcript_4943/m.10459 type:complete len:414 (-) Transcript_4943:358-1599(-)
MISVLLGILFPLFASPGEAYKLLETRTRTVCDIRAQASWNGCSATSDEESCVYSPNPGWVISNYELQIQSQSNGGQSESYTGAPIQVATSSNVAAAYEDLIDFAGKYDESVSRYGLEEKYGKNLEGRLETMFREHQSSASRFSSSRAALLVKATARAHGSCFDRKRGWSDIAYKVEETYLGPSDKVQLQDIILQEFGITRSAFEEGFTLPSNLYVRNACDKNINVAIRYLDYHTDEWTSKCWFDFASGEGAYLSSSDSRLETTNTVWYTYAESYDLSNKWSGNDLPDSITRSCRGESLLMKRQDFVDSDGDLYVKFTCNDRRLRAHHNITSEETLATSWESLPDTYSASHFTELPLEELYFKHTHEETIDPVCTSSETGEEEPCEDHSRLEDTEQEQVPIKVTHLQDANDGPS